MKKNYIKSLLLSLSLVLIGGFAFAQNGLERVIVERYYTSNAADATGSIGALPAGSVTYRVYADMITGYKFQAMYGVAAHPLTISTSTSFFNNEDRGAVTPNTIGSQYLHTNSVALDSWFSAGASATGQMGVLKSEDNGAANLITTNTMLLNNDGDAGIPLTTQDGSIAGTPQGVTFVGISAAQQSVFDATSNYGNSFTTSNGSIASLNGSTGVTSTNRVLIGQFTTNGNFHFALNIQVGTGVSGVYQNFVAANPTGTEIMLPSLTFDSNIAPPTVANVTYCSGATASPLTATAISGDTLRWYTTATGGTGSLTAPTPSTSTAGTTTYYVSQYKGSSLSPRAAIVVTVNATPTVTVNSPSICIGASATLTASGATTYSWSQGGTTAASTVTPTTTTTYTVTGTSTGCSSTATSTVTVNALPTVTVNSPTICAGTSSTLIASGANTYSWSQGGTGASSTVSPTTTASFTVTGTSTAGCVNIAVATVTVNALPTVTVNSPSICAGSSATLTAAGATSYSWSQGGTAATSTVSPATTTSYTVTGTAATGCSNTVVSTVTVNAMPTVTVNSPSICLGASATLTAAGASAYLWSTTATTAAVTVTPIATSTYTVTGTTNGCSSTAVSTVTVTVSMATPGVITGTAAVCSYVGTSTSVNYHITAVAGASSYVWTAPTGASIVSGQGTISVNISYAGSPTGGGSLGNVSVVAVSAAGCTSLPKTYAVTATLLGAPLAITGTVAVCPYVGTTTPLTYTASTVAGATSYLWTVPTGVTIISGQGTLSLIVDYHLVSGIGALGNITVAAVSNCGTGVAKALAITRTVPATPGVITGTAAVCGYVGSTTPVSYSIVAVAGATSYTWTVPTGVTLLSGQGTTSISVDFHTLAYGAATVGNITVIGNSGCGSSLVRALALTKTAVAAPLSITGQLSDLCLTNTYNYTVPVNVLATSYVWTVPTGATINSGQGTTTINVTFPSNYVTGAVTCVNSNACSLSIAKSVTVVAGPPAPGTITGSTVVCSSMQSATPLTYSIAAVTGALSYNWTAPANASIVSGQGTTTVSIQFASNFTLGNVSVASVGTCITSANKTLAVNKAAAQPGLITGSTSVCAEITAGTPVPYSVVAVTGATSYNWTIPAGASIITGAGTNAVTILFAPTTPSGALVKVASVNGCASSLVRSSTAITTCLSPLAMSGDNSNGGDLFSNIYPNPSTDFMNFDVTSDVDKDIMVEVYNVLGAEVVSQKYSITAGVTSIKTNVADLNNGVFMVRFTDLSTNTVVVKSMVK